MPRPLRLSLVLALGLLWTLPTPDVQAQEARREEGNLVFENVPEIPERIAEGLQRYENVRSAGLSGWMPGGEGILIGTRFGETGQVHHVTEPGGARRQLTFFDEPVGGAEPSPNPDVQGFLFSKDVGGSEFYQIFFYDLETGDYRMLTDGESRNGGALWSNGGEEFVYFTTKRNGTDWDLYVQDITGADSARAVLEAGGTWFPSDWAPGDTTLLVTRYVSINESRPHLLDVRTSELTPFDPHGVPDSVQVAYGGGLFAKDGSGIYFTSDYESEFRRLRFYDFDADSVQTLTSDIDWDVEGFTLSDDGRRLAFTVNEDGIGKLHVRETATGADVQTPALPTGLVYGLAFSPDGGRLAMTLNTPTTPGDVYSFELGSSESFELGSSELTRWTYSETGGLSAERFAEPELVRYETFDEVDGQPRTIPAFLYKPEGDGPFPVLVDIHGGPEGQERPYFNSTTQYLVSEMGIAVLAPNVRGSSGYGKSYLLLDNGFKREDSVQDIGALLDWIGGQPELDADRVAVYGGSYGGYMVLSSMTHYNDRLRAGIDIVGISNFVTFLENTQDYRRDLRRAEYGDERDPEMRAFLEEISPTTNAAKITKPLFVAQGLNDPRVPASESEQMVEVIREGGGEVWYFLAKDEGHGFSKKSNRDAFNQAAALFLETYLLDGKTGEGEEAATGG